MVDESTSVRSAAAQEYAHTVVGRADVRIAGADRDACMAE